MTFTPRLSFANLICHFGKHKVLKDYLDTIFLPAFFDDSLVRTYNSTDYFILEPKALSLPTSDGGSVDAICGKFVKDTVLTRTQIYKEDKGLIPDEREMDSALSAFFVLIIDNHKLLYLTETPSAPPLESFKTTILSFLKKRHRKFIDTEFKKLKEEGSPAKKNQLYREHPTPTLELVALNSRESIDQYIRELSKVEKLELRLVDTNNEIDGQELWREIRRKREALGAHSTKVVHEQKEGSGLDKEAVIQEIHDATATGNQKLNLVGLDTHGNKVRGTNQNMHFNIPVPDAPKSPDAKAKKLYELFNEQINTQTLRIDRTDGERLQ